MTKMAKFPKKWQFLVKKSLLFAYMKRKFHIKDFVSIITAL